MNQSGIGEQLIELGWSQGCRFSGRSARHVWLTRGQSGRAVDAWQIEHAALADDDLLLVVSQTCDINNDKEPYVEVVRAYWSSNANDIHAAETNSPRLFLIERRTTAHGVEGLLADLRLRISITKSALLAIEPTKSFPSEADDRLRNFQQRLGLRYRRPAIPTALVEAVQQPIANAVRKLSASHEVRRVLRKINEILILPHNAERPFQVEFAFMVSEQALEADRASVEDCALLANWIRTVLAKQDEAAIAVAEKYTYDEMSVRTYLDFYGLPLSHISIEGEPAAPDL